MILTKEICELYLKKQKNKNNVVLLASWLMKIVILVMPCKLLDFIWDHSSWATRRKSYDEIKLNEIMMSGAKLHIILTVQQLALLHNTLTALQKKVSKTMLFK